MIALPIPRVPPVTTAVVVGDNTHRSLLMLLPLLPLAGAVEVVMVLSVSFSLALFYAPLR
jgi:hypothetical protein